AGAPRGGGRTGRLGEAGRRCQRRRLHRGWNRRGRRRGGGRDAVTALLEVRGLKKRFGGLYAVSDLEFQVEPGEVVSVIGPSGAGKTTMFNLITGMYGSDGGQIVFDGQDVVGFKPNQITKLGIARTFQTVHLFPNMTVLENAMVGQHCRTKAGVLGAVLKPVLPAA